MTRRLMKGNDALAEAAVRAGCRFFGGYPITPQSEILEYLSKRMPEVGGHFIQSESEIAGISMVHGASAAGFRAMTSSSGPGFSLLQEGISYIASAELPAVFIDVQRCGSGLGDIFPGQGDYFQAVKGGGHGDYRMIVYAPASIQENVDLTLLAFEKADHYMNPVLILSDAAIASMMEPVTLPPVHEHDPDTRKQAVMGKGNGRFKTITSTQYYIEDFDAYIKEKYDNMASGEALWESVETDDADLVFVAYGIASRLCKEAVFEARKRGIKLGLLRPITLWPFPSQAVRQISNHTNGFMTAELTPLPMIHQDVMLSMETPKPVYTLGTGSRIPSTREIIKRAEKCISELKKGGNNG